MIAYTQPVCEVGCLYGFLCVCLFFKLLRMRIFVRVCVHVCARAWLLHVLSQCMESVGGGRLSVSLLLASARSPSGEVNQRCGVCQCVCAMSVCKRINNSVLHYTLPLFNLKLGTDTDLPAYTHTRVHTNTHTAICL